MPGRETFLRSLLKMILEKLAEYIEEYPDQCILHPMMWPGKTVLYLLLEVGEPVSHHSLGDDHRSLSQLIQTVKKDGKK